MSRFMMCCVVLLSFLVYPVVTSAAPEETKTAVEAKAPEEAKAEAPEAKAEEEAKAPEAKAEEAKAEEPEPTTEELIDQGKEILAAARSHEWALMVAAIIMLLLGVARKFKVLEKIPARAVPWVSMVLGVLAVLGDDLATGGALTVSRVVQGALAGMAASGAWSMIGRHLPMVGAKKAA